MTENLKNLTFRLFLLLPLALATGCMSEGSLNQSYSDPSQQTTYEYGGSYFITPIPKGTADGSSKLTVSVCFLNSDRTPIAGHAPSLSINPSSQTTGTCTSSDSMGISICEFTSTAQGKFTVQITNIPVSLMTDIQFLP
jgi:hypothetical protein